jgi:hypothetical protein
MLRFTIVYVNEIVRWLNLEYILFSFLKTKPILVFQIVQCVLVSRWYQSNVSSECSKSREAKLPIILEYFLSHYSLQ